MHSKTLAWRLRGRPLPPPEWAKRYELLSFARTFGLHTLVETGTYLGETVATLRRYFRRVVSIELQPTLYGRAAELFDSSENVEIVFGDSAEVLPGILEQLEDPALFWLDGHYSGGETARGTSVTPVLQELRYILGHRVTGHVVLIDDARLFGTDGYPSFSDVESEVLAAQPSRVIVVKDDIIRIF